MHGNAVLACCKSGAGYGSGGNGGSVNLTGSGGNTGTRPGLLESIGKAIDNAVHGGNSGFMNNSSGGQGNVPGPTSSYGMGSNVVPFPMVNPFKPVIETGVPVPGLTTKPRNVYDVSIDESGVPDDEQFAGLGFVEPLGQGGGWDLLREGVSLNNNPTKLQTILGTIQATLPATIQAFRANPSNIFPGATYNPYTTNAGGTYPGSQGAGAGADIGATAGAAAGNVADSIGSIVQRHPYLILAGGAALLLLFMNPPRRGR